MRSLLLATLALLLGAPAANAAVTVDIDVSPPETRFGSTTEVHGTVAVDGVPSAGQPVQLQGRPYPYEAAFAPVATAITAADGSYTFERDLGRNWQFRAVALGTTSARARAYVFPATKLTYKDQGDNRVRLTQRYVVPRGVRLKQPTLFYVTRSGRATAPRVARTKLVRIRPGRYRSTATVRIPESWNGRFRFASCFRYSGRSGMGNPRASCPKRFRF